jgi:LysM repeat protein
MKKKGHLLSIVFLFLQFLTACTLQSQTTEIIRGREFIVHQVKHGETVYGIAKKYDVPQDSIFAYNSSAKTGIKTDQVLKFPSKNSVVQQNNNQQQPTTDQWISHTVTQGETLYGIARKYHTTVEEIEKANPKVKEGLKIDDVLSIPVNKGTVVRDDEKDDHLNDNNNNTNVTNNGGTKNDEGEANCDTVQALKKNFNVALILPFKGNNFASSKIATEFYYGFKVALDSVAAKMKVAVKLYVMNSTAANDSDKTADEYDYDKLKKMDLIIGPLFSANIKPIAQFAKENKIPIVSPFTKSGTLLEGNPFAIKITPSEKTLAKRTLTYFNTTFPNCNFILVNTNNRRDSILHLAYSDGLDELGITDTNRIHKINGKNASPSAYFKGGVKNVVIYVNSREVTVKSFITGFNRAYKGNDISLVGTEGWLEFNNVEADYYMNLNLHIPVATYADFTDSTKYDYFIRKYQYTVKADPTDYSFTGYKIGSDFMRRFFTYGPYVCDCIDKYKEKDEKQKIPFNLVFYRQSASDGWENNAIQILRVQEDYILDIINY